jgi:nicotinate-nucleotide pyrophosphorylase (carboxylating)
VAEEGRGEMNSFTGDEASRKRVDELVRLALEEDLPDGDVTTEATLDVGLSAKAVIVAGERLVVSGLLAARRVFEAIDVDVQWKEECRDGEALGPGALMVRLEGPAASLLAGERTSLNFLQHLSGIATATRRMVNLVRGERADILDTRKTLPGWRLLEKAAVRHGGGRNHRFSLSDSVLIKDNHVALGGGVAETVRRARSRLPPGTRIEVETSSREEVLEALEAGADVILVDNTTPAALEEAVRLVGDRAALEVSGGIGEDNVGDMARTGVGMISAGALTHSARAVDISMEID